MMIPKPFDSDIAMWRKWKDEVTKYFDVELEGMKNTKDATSKWTFPMTEENIEEHSRLLPHATPVNVLRHWSKCTVRWKS